MRKKILIKATALLVCIAFLSLSAPGLVAGEKIEKRSNVRILIEKPAAMMSSFLSYVHGIFYPGMKIGAEKGKGKSNGSNPIVKPTGDLDSEKISDGD